jgi:hypothetical protein
MAEPMASRLLEVEARFNTTGQPFDWRFIRRDLAAMLAA